MELEGEIEDWAKRPARPVQVRRQEPVLLETLPLSASALPDSPKGAHLGSRLAWSYFIRHSGLTTGQRRLPVSFSSSFRMPSIKASGRGGHPGINTSTGNSLSTPSITA